MNGTEGAVALSEMLKTNTTLTTFVLDSVPFLFDKGIKNTESKHHIWMTDNGIGDEGAKLLSESLKVNTTLLNFNLWSLESRQMNEESNSRRKNRLWDWTRRSQITFRSTEGECESLAS